MLQYALDVRLHDTCKLVARFQILLLPDSCFVQASASWKNSMQLGKMPINTEAALAALSSTVANLPDALVHLKPGVFTIQNVSRISELSPGPFSTFPLKTRW